MESALSAAQRLHDREMESTHLGNLCSAYITLREFDLALKRNQQALDIDHKAGISSNDSIYLNNKGMIYVSLGKPEIAIGSLKEALKIDRDKNDQRGESATLGNLGNAYLSLHKPNQLVNFLQYWIIPSLLEY